MVTDTCEITGKVGFEFGACIVCEVSDALVSRCSGADCIVSFHEECLTSEYGGSDDLSNPFCPYCWFKFVSLKSNSLREKAIEAEKAVLSYLDSKDSEKSKKLLTEETEQREECNDKADTCVVKKGDVSRFSSLRERGQVLQNQKQSRRRRRVELNDGSDSKDVEEDAVNIENLQDAEDDDETATVQTNVKSGGVESYSGIEYNQVQNDEKRSSRRRRTRVELNVATDCKSGDMEEDLENLQDVEDGDETAIVQPNVKSGGVESYSGIEHNEVQKNEKLRRRSMVVLSDDTDSEISSTKEEENGEDVTEQITSKNQQIKLREATKSNTPREVSFFKKDQRRRLLWTSEEEDMLKVGVEKFAEANKNVPWRKILKWGENVFHKTRSSADLKDKWRNMIKLM